MHVRAEHKMNHLKDHANHITLFSRLSFVLYCNVLRIYSIDLCTIVLVAVADFALEFVNEKVVVTVQKMLHSGT